MSVSYPGRVIVLGETDAALVRALKLKLNERLVLDNDPEQRLDPDNPNFGPKMEQAIELFQTRHVDTSGHPLVVDGQVGSLTWEALFGSADAPAVPVIDTATDPFLGAVLAIAGRAADRRVREVPVNSNRGPEVDEFLKRAGSTPGYAWCCAFTYWCFDEAAKAASRSNPMVRTAGCLDHWNRAPSKGARRILAEDAVANPALLRPGMLFVLDKNGVNGHTGFIERVQGGLLHTIEGNTDASGTNEGGGVYRLVRKVSTISKGYIDYSDR
ncbi:CHAP domain-containing protein [Derxia lacustris]|uniref:CHAP domain-containing protein n=1 Tax=Derxia lacustris TaxID=764842 RepID=UPI001C38C044|nr:CHAP domain-containing protein [Derxia lacustris]